MEEKGVVERERRKKGERGRDKDDIGNMLGKYQTYQSQRKYNSKENEEMCL